MTVNQSTISIHGSRSSISLFKSRKLVCVTVTQPSDGSGGLGGVVSVTLGNKCIDIITWEYFPP